MMLDPKFSQLPGGISEKELLDQFVRVDQAGEYGAKRIYQGQLAILKNDECAATLSHMAEQEEEHLSYFNNQIKERLTRPSALMPLWHVAGYALGAATALMGKKSAMACTVAIEEVIDEHYQEQLVILEKISGNHELKTNIEKFRQEELEHRDIGLTNGAEQATCYKLLSFGIKLGAKLAIEIAKRV